MAPSLALVATAAYARVPQRGPRDLQAGHGVVDVLGRLEEPGARELVRIRERAHYGWAKAKASKVLVELERRLGIPLGELEDSFGGPTLDADLAMTVHVGPYEAHLRVSGDLRRVRTSWRGGSGRMVRSRPPLAADYPHELSHVESERRRLQAHLTDLRSRLELAMRSARSWTAEQWVARMFADPLRAALARRLVWRIEDTGKLALPQKQGLCDERGTGVTMPSRSNISLWHPADSAATERGHWRERLEQLEVDQPVEQAEREVTRAYRDSPRLGLASGKRVEQTPFRGFLTDRGWRVPNLGSGFDVPEATLELIPGGPVAVLYLDGDDNGRGEDTVTVGELGFRSTQELELDARRLPPALVSEAARDVLGAVKVGSPRDPGPVAGWLVTSPKFRWAAGLGTWLPGTSSENGTASSLPCT